MRKFIHVTSPDFNYYPMYSVEFQKRTNPLPPGFPQPWEQFGLTNNRWLARWYGIECRLSYPLRKHRTRVL